METVVHEYGPRGAAAELFRNKAPEVLIEGPAGTGKTRPHHVHGVRRCLLL